MNLRKLLSTMNFNTEMVDVATGTLWDAYNLDESILCLEDVSKRFHDNPEVEVNDKGEIVNKKDGAVLFVLKEWER